jgi:nitroreductase
METIAAIRKRRSVRKFTGTPVARNDLITIVDAGRLDASGYNAQPWDFIVVTDRSRIEQLSIVTSWIKSAGAIIAVVMDPGSEFWLEDGSAAIQNILIAATSLGYGSCWVEGDALRLEERLKGMLAIPADKRLLALVPIGKALDWPTIDKKQLEDVIHWEHYQARD